MNSARLLVGYRVAMAILVGTILALPMLFIANYIGGGGHGSNYGFCTFFGPSTVVLDMAEISGTNTTDLTWCVVTMIGLYGIYGGVLAGARLVRVGLWAFFTIMCFHYGALAWLAITAFPGSEFHTLVRVLSGFSLPRIVIVAELFIGLHVVACQYALSTPPYRPRLTRPVISVLGVGLAAGIALFVWARLTGR